MVGGIPDVPASAVMITLPADWFTCSRNSSEEILSPLVLKSRVKKWQFLSAMGSFRLNSGFRGLRLA